MFGAVVHGIVQDGEQQVLLIHLGGTLDTRLQHGEFQYVAGLFVQHEVCRVDRHADLVFPDALLQLGLYRLQVQVQSVEQVNDGSFAVSEHTQQQVFRTYRTAGQTCSFLTRKGEDLRYSW